MSLRSAAAQRITRHPFAPELYAAPHGSFPVNPDPLATRDPHSAPWPLNETDLDLPDDPPPPVLQDPGNDPLYLGTVTVTQRGIGGPFSLDVLLAADGSALEIGPFRLDRDQLRRLDRLFLIVRALIGHDRPPTRPWPAAESGRGITGWDFTHARPCADLAQEGLSEGETRP